MAFSIRNKRLFPVVLLLALPLSLPAQNRIPEKDHNSFFRMDINAIPDRIVLRGEKQQDANVHNAGWYREDSKFVLTVNAKEPLKEEWKIVSLHLVPSTDRLSLSLLSWKQKGWFEIRDFRFVEE